MKAAAVNQHMSLEDEIRIIINDHIKWLQSEGKEGRRANFAGYDLSGMELQHVYLPEASLRSANLTGTNFTDANLQGADLSDAHLERTNFREASMDGANFSRSYAAYAYFDGAQMVDCNFSHTNLTEASLKGAQLSGGKFREALALRANFSRACMKQAILRGADLTEAVLNEADLTGADCREAVMHYARFKDACLNETNFRTAQLDHVLFTDTDFSYSIDLEAHYQSMSLESEKKGIQQELENLRRTKDEVVQYEARNHKQKREITQKRKLLLGLADLEAEISSSLLEHMTMFRYIAIFWFVIVALLATIAFFQISKIGIESFDLIEISALLLVLMGILGAHVFSAILSLNVAKKFARYVRLRRETLADDGFFTDLPGDAEQGNYPTPATMSDEHDNPTLTYV